MYFVLNSFKNNTATILSLQSEIENAFVCLKNRAFYKKCI